jgi:PAS domain S-box-containing protein
MLVEAIVGPCPLGRKRDTSLCRYGSAILLVLFAVAIPFRLSVCEDLAYVLAFAAVVMSGLWGGLGPAIFSAGSSALAINFLFIAPSYRLSLAPDPEDAFRTALFLVSSIMVGAFVADCRRLKQKLYASEERYRALADTSPDALIIVDEQARIVYLNCAAEKVYHCAASSIVGKELEQCVPKLIYESAFSQLKLQRDSRRPTLVLEPSLVTESEGRAIQFTGGTLTRHGGDMFALRMRGGLASTA